MRTVIFIYAKDNKIKALTHEQSIKIGKALVDNGWKHTSTLDPCLFIEHLHNETNDKQLTEEIKELSS